jgi:hypothetical protein
MITPPAPEMETRVADKPGDSTTHTRAHTHTHSCRQEQIFQSATDHRESSQATPSCLTQEKPRTPPPTHTHTHTERPLRSRVSYFI